MHAVEKEDRLLYHQYVAGNYEEINLVGTLFACTVSQAKVKASIQSRSFLDHQEKRIVHIFHPVVTR